MNLGLKVLLTSLTIYDVLSQSPQTRTVRWCTQSAPEYNKCLALAGELRYYQAEFSNSYQVLQCIQRPTHDECMILLDQKQADLVSLDANEIFIGGRYHSLIPLVKEVYGGNEEYYYSVAVVKKGDLSDVTRLGHLKGTVGCFHSVSSMTGWVIPIARLIEFGGMEIVDCNSHVKSASKFFQAGCSVNILTNKYNSLGDNDQKLCSACGSESPTVRCGSYDPHAGFLGALRCLMTSGNIAFVKHTSLPQAMAAFSSIFNYTIHDFELLCLDGTRASPEDYIHCNWGRVPANAIVTSTAKNKEERQMLQTFLKMMSTHFSEKPQDPKRFHLFESFPKYGESYDLLVSDDAIKLVEITSREQDFQTYLDPSVKKDIEKVRSCPIKAVTLCVTSYAEMNKCRKMKIALDAQLLKPEMNCMNGGSQYGCMSAIKRRDADIAVFEAGDIYTAGLEFGLIPIMAEQYNLDSTYYYVVAVSKEDDPDTDVLYLRGRYTCHPSVMHGGGWIIPMAYLLNNDFIRDYGCNSVVAASQYFQKSCAPGALSPPYNHDIAMYNLCHLCRGSTGSHCARDHTEPFFGFTGAFRCLVEGGGQVAFLKHTTVQENTDGKRKEWWARNQLTADYELVCRDGTRAPVTEYERCNLGKVRSNAVVTRGGYDRNDTEIQAYTNLLLYAQQLFGRDFGDEWNFKLFESDLNYAQYSDLIFQDATQQLVPLREEEQHYHPYLGYDFLNARYRVDCKASGNIVDSSLLVMVCVLMLHLFVCS